MRKLIEADEKFWREAEKYHSASELADFRSFLEEIQSDPRYRLVAGGLKKGQSPTIRLLLAEPTHGIRSDNIFLCFEIVPRKSAIRFWIQYWKQPDCDPRLESDFREILDSGSRKWHFFNSLELREQIDSARRVLKALESFYA
ncbi:MAG: hypothetical protein ACODAJ_09495 [Planctomycetota bacterium]